MWNLDFVDITDTDALTFSLSAMVSTRRSDDKFKITIVYDPTDYALKDAFFQELVDLKPESVTKWIVLGDFNQIHRAHGKSNLNINRSRMTRFRAALHSCELIEIPLQNQKFT
jgi:hypothetical protein